MKAFKKVSAHYFYMNTVFVYTTPHYSHQALADKLEITTSIKTPTGGLFSIPFLGKILAARSIQPQLRKLKPDVILTESMTRDLLAAHYYKRKNRMTKIVSILADPKLHYIKEGYDIDKMITYGSLKSVDWFLCSGKQMQDILPEKQRIHSTVFYPKMNYEPNNFFPKFKNKNNFYFVGSLIKSKGIDEMNKFFVNSGDQLIVYGDGPDKYKLHRQISYRGYNSNPHESAIDEVAYIVSFADFEPFGLAPIEGMLFGAIPFVSSRCGCKEIVSQLDPSLVFDTPEEIRSMHHKLRENEDLFKQYSKKAKEIAEEYFKLSSNSYEKCVLDIRLNVFHPFLYK